MKVVVLACLVIAFVCIPALGQGQFIFNNQAPPDVNARFFTYCDPPNGGYSSVGTNFTVQLFNRNAGGTLIPLDPPETTFLGAAGTPGAGYVRGVTETVPDVPSGVNAIIVVRFSGPSVGGGRYDLGPYSLTLGGGATALPLLPLGTAPITIDSYFPACPEPSTAVLALGGIGALLIYQWARRRVPERGRAE